MDCSTDLLMVTLHTPSACCVTSPACALWERFLAFQCWLSVCVDFTVWSMLFVFHLQSYSLPYGSTGVCKDTKTEFLHNNLCCSKCRPGRRACWCMMWWSDYLQKCCGAYHAQCLTADTGTRLVSYCTGETDTQCEPCDAGMYSEDYNYYPNCFSCATCQEGRKPSGTILTYCNIIPKMINEWNIERRICYITITTTYICRLRDDFCNCSIINYSHQNLTTQKTSKLFSPVLSERGLMYTKRCSSEGNAECECKPGWYCVLSEEPCTACEQHRKCGPGKGAVSAGRRTHLL